MRVNNQNINGTAPGMDASASKKAEQAKAAGKATEAKKTQANAPAEISDAVKTDISPKAKEMAEAKAVASAAPDIREAKIAELKQRIANKQYNVKPEDVADRMVNEHLQTRGIG